MILFFINNNKKTFIKLGSVFCKNCKKQILDSYNLNISHCAYEKPTENYKYYYKVLRCR